MKILCWIQHPDFTAEDHGDVNVATAVNLFTDHDWTSEFDLLEKIHEQRGDHCDPGIGYVAEDGRALHLCPLEGERAYFNYTYREPRRLFGMVAGTRKKTRTNMNIAKDILPDLIRHFFNGEHESLIAATTYTPEMPIDS